MAKTIDTVITASKYEYRKVSLDKISVDRRVQRDEPDPKRIDKMVAEFDPDGLGTVTLSQRPNGEIVALDGQHRYLASKLTGEVSELDAKVFLDLWREGPESGLKAEARIFTLTNRHVKIGSVDSFRVAVTAGNAEALQVMHVLNTHGLTPKLSYHPGAFSAIATAMRIARRPGGLDLLDRSLTVLQEAWGDTRFTLDGRLVEGMSAFLHRYVDEVRQERLIKQLRSEGEAGPKTILEKAITIRATVERGPMKFAVAQAIAGSYNRGLQDANKLPSWRVTKPASK